MNTPPLCRFPSNAPLRHGPFSTGLENVGWAPASLADLAATPRGGERVASGKAWRALLSPALGRRQRFFFYAARLAGQQASSRAADILKRFSVMRVRARAHTHTG